MADEAAGVVGYEAPDFETISAADLDEGVALMSSGGGDGDDGEITTGSYSNPSLLVPGTSKSVTAKTYWFKCVVAGSIDLSIASGGSYTAALYKRSGNGDTLTVLASYDSRSVPVSTQVPLYGSSTLYLEVIGAATQAFVCQIDQHVDIATLEEGGRWDASDDPGSNSSDTTPVFMFCFTADKIGYVITAIEQDEYINWVEDVVDGIITAAEAAGSIVEIVVAAYTGGLSEAAIMFIRTQYEWIVTELVEVLAPEIIKAIPLQEIIEITGIDDWIHPEALAQYGLRLLVSRDELGAPYLSVEEWEGTDASGPAGSIGLFTRYFDDDNDDDD